MDEARINVDRLLKSFNMPVTRQQWSEWLGENLTEFRAKMVSTPGLRRQGSLRVRARHGLPGPVKRLQPRAIKHSECREEWARNLKNRMGWHGIKTRRQGVIIVFLIFLHRRTHYLSVRNRAATGAPKCMLDINFSLVDSVYELAHLEDLLVDDEVLMTW